MMANVQIVGVNGEVGRQGDGDGVRVKGEEQAVALPPPAYGGLGRI